MCISTSIYLLHQSRSPQLPPPSALSIRWASRPPHRSLYLEQQRGGEHRDTFRSSRFPPEICPPIAWSDPEVQPCLLGKVGQVWQIRFMIKKTCLFVIFQVLVESKCLYASVLHLSGWWLNHWTISPRKGESNHNQTHPTSVDIRMQYTVSVFGI